MHNNVKWASYTEEGPDLLYMTQIGQLGSMSVSQCEPQVRDCSSR